MNKLLVVPARKAEPAPPVWLEPQRRLQPGWQPKEKVFALALVGLLFLAGVAVVTQTVRVNLVGYRLAQVRQEVERLERDNERLALEVAALKGPARVAQLAEQRLGMVAPDAAHVLRLPPGAVAQAALAVQGRPAPALAEGEPPAARWQVLARAFARWLGTVGRAHAAQPWPGLEGDITGDAS